MPTYASWFEVDWQWPELGEPERAIVRRYHANLSSDPDSVSYTFLRELLTKASVELPSRTIRVRGADPDDDEDDVDNEWEFSICDQTVSDDAGDFDPGGSVPEERVLRSDSRDKISQPLYFDESVLKEIESEAYRQDRSLSWMAQKAWLLARTEIRALPVYGSSDED